MCQGYSGDFPMKREVKSLINIYIIRIRISISFSVPFMGKAKSVLSYRYSQNKERTNALSCHDISQE